MQMIRSHRNFGVLTAKQVEVDIDETDYRYLSFRDANDDEWQEVANQFGPFDYYLAVDHSGAIYSMESDPDASQISGLDIIGINVTESFPYTRGPGGTIYGKIWEDGTIVDPSLVPTPEGVDQERDRRIDGGFSFGGVFYQTRPDDRENIAGASTAALAAIINGAEPGDYRWHGGDTDFVWIAADNSTNAMDAQTLFAFGQAAMAHKQAHIFAAREIKDADPIPADYTNDAYWPSV